MSWSMATVNAYDVMGEIAVTAVVRTAPPGGGESISTVLQCSTTFPGVGEDDPREWLRDVLVGLLEVL
jgi:hypothetical protein